MPLPHRQIWATKRVRYTLFRSSRQKGGPAPPPRNQLLLPCLESSHSSFLLKPNVLNLDLNHDRLLLLKDSSRDVHLLSPIHDYLLLLWSNNRNILLPNRNDDRLFLLKSNERGLHLCGQNVNSPTGHLGLKRKPLLLLLHGLSSSPGSIRCLCHRTVQACVTCVPDIPPSLQYRLSGSLLPYL